MQIIAYMVFMASILCGVAMSDTVAIMQLPLMPHDPHPNLPEATLHRHDLSPRYALPPQGFNTDNSFEEALIDFDTISGWAATLSGCSTDNAAFCLSNDQSLRGVPNVKLECTPAEDQPHVRFSPPEDIHITKPFDILECWIYGYFGGATLMYELVNVDQETIYVGSSVCPAPRASWGIHVHEGWCLARTVLDTAMPAGTLLRAIHVWPNVLNTKQYPTCLIHLDQLRTVLFDKYISQPAPQFPHAGTPVENVPTRLEGSCPQTLQPVTTTADSSDTAANSKTCTFRYVTSDNKAIEYQYRPASGTLSDLGVRTSDGHVFYPAAGSGPVFDFGDGQYIVPDESGLEATLRDCRLAGDRLHVVWEYATKADKASDEHRATVDYQIYLSGKTLCIDVSSSTRKVAAWHFGQATDLHDARVFGVQFMRGEPNVLLTHGLFVRYAPDWYVSNVSQCPPYADNECTGSTARYSWKYAGTKPFHTYAYLKRTDQQRLPLRERLYLTVSEEFVEVLPTVANPPSPYRDKLVNRQYYMSLCRSADSFSHTRDFVDRCAHYGMTDFWHMYHARLWFRRNAYDQSYNNGDMDVSLALEPAGGNQALIELFDYMKSLGIAPGYYDGYPSPSESSSVFNKDWTTYFGEGAWMYLWYRPQLKPWAFPELAATMCRKRAQRYKPMISYQDGITSHPITHASDFDHRYERSGTIRETLRALATGWQRVRENVDGPVISEGRGNFYHVGLNDGDYGKLTHYPQAAHEAREVMLVDFRLRNIAHLSTTVGINFGTTHYACGKGCNRREFISSGQVRRWLHHNIACQIAFGALGMLEVYNDLPAQPVQAAEKTTGPVETHDHERDQSTVKPLHRSVPGHDTFDLTMSGYFLLHALQQRYMMQPVADIQYSDGEKMYTTSDALRADVVRQNLVYIRYNNGLVLYINLSWDDRNWQITHDGTMYVLPPGGWLAVQNDELLCYSCLRDGGRVDFVDCPEYTYLDGHGRTVDAGGYRTDRQMVVWKTGPLQGRQLQYPAMHSRSESQGSEAALR